MNRTVSTILIALAVVVVAGGLFFAGTMFARNGFLSPRTMISANTGVSDRDASTGPGATYGMGPGMMGNRRPNYHPGPGMMGGGRGNYGMGPGMMGEYGWWGAASNLAPLTVDEAKMAANNYVASLSVPDLALGEIMVFDNNAYVVVVETTTAQGAFELLVDPSSKVAYPEPGPNMMWNLKYGGLIHGNMMGRQGGMMRLWNPGTSTPTSISADMPIAPDEAVKNAQAYLDKFVAGATAAEDPIRFYGYYTLDFTKDGKIAGMLSVDGYRGDVFLHTWHGTFVEEAK